MCPVAPYCWCVRVIFSSFWGWHISEIGIFIFSVASQIQKMDTVYGKDPELSLLVKAVKGKTQKLA